MNIENIKRQILSAVTLALIITFSQGIANAESISETYKKGATVLEQVGGGKACLTCLTNKYRYGEQPKAYALSKDGAYGASWGRNRSLKEVRRLALKSCQEKPTYTPKNPCFIFFENDKQVWKP
jgi:hypothetical protein